ncbi:MAG: hypothetical protein ACE5FH_04390 [Candidatus Zixiibacteriota bacterium]
MISIVRRPYNDDSNDGYSQLNETNPFNSSGLATLWGITGADAR